MRKRGWAVSGAAVPWIGLIEVIWRSKLKRLSRLLSAMFLALCLVVSSLEPCTLVSVCRNGFVVMGVNEDASPDHRTKVWFREREEGRFGYLCFGFADGFAQGGMNEQGLAVAWAAGYPSDWRRSPDMRDYPGNLSLKILAECRSVEEALSLYERYNQPDFQYARTMLADRTGRSAVIGWGGGKINIVPKRGEFQVAGFGAPVVERLMRGEIPATVEGLMAVMTKSRQKGETPTRYSVVYDLARGEATVFNIERRPASFFGKLLGRRKAGRKILLNLGRELKKGNHTYHLSSLFDELGRPPRIDGSSLMAVEAEPEAWSRYEGRFESPAGLIASVRTGGPHLLLEWPPNETVKVMALRRFGENRFFAEYRDLQVEFLIGEGGLVSSALFRWRERDGRFREARGVRIRKSVFERGVEKRRRTPGSRSGLPFPLGREFIDEFPGPTPFLRRQPSAFERMRLPVFPRASASRCPTLMSIPPS